MSGEYDRGLSVAWSDKKSELSVLKIRHLMAQNMQLFSYISLLINLRHSNPSIR